MAAATFALIHFRVRGNQIQPTTQLSEPPIAPNLWARSLERVKEDRGEAGDVALEIPAQLRHYSDRHWFLATQVAEVKKLNVQRCQDLVDLAALIERGELVPLPAVTDTYILYGVGARADDSAFTRYVADQNLALDDEAGLRDAYTRLSAAHVQLEKEVSGLQAQVAELKQSTSANQDELLEDLSASQQALKANDSEKLRLERYFGVTTSLQEGSPGLRRDYNALQALAKNFGGRSFNLDDPLDRQALKIYLLSSLRPQALKVLEEVAAAYHDKFARPLPVSSLTRPEQYQRALRRVNRYAVTIDTPPHSTGLAFDIDYRYMSGAEQNFLMETLARMKDEGRIEVLRERGANYHVFAFIDGTRPSDELVTAALAEAGGTIKQTNNDSESEARPRTKSPAGKKGR